MSEEMLNTVDAVTEEVVTPQAEEQVAEVESVQSEVATDTPVEEVVSDEKPVQSKEDNAQFAEVRRKAEQVAQDKLIEEMYGKTHNIHTKADYDKAMREQKEAELVAKMKDSDNPETVKQELYKQWEQNDPRLKEYEKIKVENYTSKQLKDLNEDLKSLGIDEVKSIDEMSKLPSADKIIEHINKGKTLDEAYFLANKSEIIKAQAQKIQADTLTKSAQLDNASPGALDSTVGADKSNSVFNMSKDKFEQMKEDALMGRLRK